MILISGEKQFRSVVNDCTKENAALKKIIAPKKYVRRFRDRSSPDRRDRSPRRSDHSRGSEHNKGKSGQNQKRKNSGDGGPGSGSSKDTKSRAKKSKPSPAKKKGTSSLSDPVYSFLDIKAINMVKAVGLNFDNLSIVDKLPIGGRLTKFYDNWLKLNCADWVLSVVKEGYKIPLRSIPHQKKIPTNPKVVDKAHEVLVNEANDLLTKEAVTIVEPCEGPYVSSYFVVLKPRRVDQFRPILNLKVFNFNVRKYKFTMETLQSVREWLKHGFYCVSLDIKDA